MSKSDRSLLLGLAVGAGIVFVLTKFALFFAFGAILSSCFA